MYISIIISIVTLVLSIVINACLVAFLLGKMSANQESIKLLLETHKEHTTEHFKRLEKKQDRHNNLIERVTIEEQSTKSAHHRIDDLRAKVDKLEEFVK